MAKMTAHPNLNIPIRVAIAFMALRLLFFFLDWQWDPVDMTFLFIGLAGLIPLCIYALWPRQTTQSLLEGIFASMRVVLTYSILVTVFYFVYYSFVDVGYFPEMRELILQREIANSPPEQHAEIGKNIARFFSVRNFSVLLLIVFMAFSIFYAVFFTAIKRVALKRKV